MTDRGSPGSSFQSLPEALPSGSTLLSTPVLPWSQSLAPGSPQAVSFALGASLLGAFLTWRRPLVLFAPRYSTIHKAQPTAL